MTIKEQMDQIKELKAALEKLEIVLKDRSQEEREFIEAVINLVFAAGEMEGIRKAKEFIE